MESEAATIIGAQPPVTRAPSPHSAPTTPMHPVTAGLHPMSPERLPMLASSSSHGSLHGRFTPGQVLGGRYRIVGLLGRGGMGEVYRADDLTLGMPVALKFLPLALGSDPTKLARFLNEVRTTRQISHSAVCRVFDVVEISDHDPAAAAMAAVGPGAGPMTIEAARQAAMTGSRAAASPGSRSILYCISMEYVDGEDLGSLLRRIGRLPQDKAIEIARQICAGLAAAHEQGIVHRDLKPANIMLDGRGKSRVMDFGVAGLSEALNATGDVTAGTPAYMAPEQLSGQGVSTRSDLYSLGLVLYELFTGKPAWADKASSLGELRRLHDTTDPAAPSTLVPGIDPLIERVILRCLERDPARRPASALQVAAALPGGDPLAAALAAGETPSPEMVAASGAVGALSVRAAVLWAALLVASLAALIGLTRINPTTIEDMAPLAPAALRAKGEEILRTLGHPDRPQDFAFGFAWAGGVAEHLKQENRKATESAGETLRITDPWLPALRFFHRISPADMLLPHPSQQNITFDNPPQVMSGSARLELDARGRLLRYETLPMRPASTSDLPDAKPATKPEPDWSRFMVWAGLDSAALAETTPEWPPIVPSDARHAWTSTIPTTPPTPIRIEAASEAGVPVSFMIIYPWTAPDRQVPPSGKLFLEQALPVILTTLVLVAIGGGVLITVRHTRAGRVDARGAVAIWIAIFLSAWLGGAIAPENPAALFRVQTWLGNALYYALWVGGLEALFYVSCEPILRKVWPGTLVSWARVLAGRWRDPLVGRDMLVGLSLGAAFAVLLSTGGLLRFMQDGEINQRFDGNIAALRSFNALASHLLRGLGNSAVMTTLLIGMLLLGFRLLLRSNRLAACAVFIVLLAIHIAGFGDNTGGVIMALAATIMVTTLIIVGGLLPMVAMLVFTNVIAAVPLTWDPSSWAFPYTLVLVVLTVVSAAWALRTALGGRRLMAADAMLD